MISLPPIATGPRSTGAVIKERIAIGVEATTYKQIWNIRGLKRNFQTGAFYGSIGTEVLVSSKSSMLPISLFFRV